MYENKLPQQKPYLHAIYENLSNLRGISLMGLLQLSYKRQTYLYELFEISRAEMQMGGGLVEFSGQANEAKWSRRFTAVWAPH